VTETVVTVNECTNVRSLRSSESNGASAEIGEARTSTAAQRQRPTHSDHSRNEGPPLHKLRAQCTLFSPTTPTTPPSSSHRQPQLLDNMPKNKGKVRILCKKGGRGCPTMLRDAMTPHTAQRSTRLRSRITWRQPLHTFSLPSQSIRTLTKTTGWQEPT
jgi:hypothetical protein